MGTAVTKVGRCPYCGSVIRAKNPESHTSISIGALAADNWKFSCSEEHKRRYFREHLQREIRVPSKEEIVDVRNDKDFHAFMEDLFDRRVYRKKYTFILIVPPHEILLWKKKIREELEKRVDQMPKITQKTDLSCLIIWDFLPPRY